MPPKAPPGKKGPPAAAPAKKAPAAVLAKMKAAIEAQRKAEEEWARQQEEEEKKRKEEERLAELERKREEEEKRLQKEAQKETMKADKKDSKQKAAMEALERMRAAGMIVPDLPPAGAEKPKAVPKATPKPAPKKQVEKPKHEDPVVVPEPTPAEPTPAEDEIADDWEALLAADEAKAAEDAAKEEAAKAAAPASTSEGDAAESSAPPQATTGSPKGGAGGAGGAGAPVAGSPSKGGKAGELKPAIELRSPICCVLGHVDTGKTSLLDKIRQTNVQGGEAGGITQQIGATFFPREALESSTRELRAKYGMELKVPGLLVIDTPGHESFTNLRSRGSNLCDIAVLVIDIMHGLEQQTIESLKLLRQRKCPFMIALNKMDRLYEWIETKDSPIQDSLAKQKKHVIQEFETRVQNVITELNEQGFNAELYYKNKDSRTYVNIVPTSARTGEGVPDLIMLEIQLVQKFMEGKVSFKEDLQCTVLEVKPIQGIGTTIDVVLVNGTLHYGDRIVICGMNGPIITQIRALLTPQPMRELRVKAEYIQHKEVRAAMGVKISAENLEHAVPGTPLIVVPPGASTADAEKEVMKDFSNLLGGVSKSGEGVAVQSSTIGSLEALLAFFKDMKIPVSAINLGPLHKRHLLNMVAMRERQPKFAIVLAFDVQITKEAQEFADKNGIKIFNARIIYHLFDQFTKYVENYDNEVKERNRPFAHFPVVLTINECIRAKDPIILHCNIVRGQLHLGTPILVQSTGTVVGKVIGMEKDKKEVKVGKKGMDIAVKIHSSDSNLTFGRQLDEKSTLVSVVTRKAIDALKESFRSEMDDDDWVLIKKLAIEQGVSVGGKAKKKPALKEGAPAEPEEEGGEADE